MRRIKKGSADVTIEVFAVDALTGQPRAGLTYGDVTAYHVRTRAGAVAIAATALASPADEHADGGFVEIDATACPGWYRFDLPDAAVAAGAEAATIALSAAGVLFAPARIELVEATIGEVSGEVHLCKAALVNKRVHTISSGVDEIKDDDGTTTLVTMTPTDGGDDVIEVAPS